MRAGREGQQAVKYPATCEPSFDFPFHPGDVVERDGFKLEVTDIKHEAMVEYVESDGRLWRKAKGIFNGVVGKG